MGLKERIISWLYANLKIKVSTVTGLVEKLDADEDGYIEACEIVQLIREASIKMVRR